MTTAILILALIALFAGLVRYAQRDRFAAAHEMPNGGHPIGMTAAQDVLR